MTENVEKFVAHIAASLASETFVRLTLGNYRGQDEHLQKLLVRLVQTKKGLRLFFLYRAATRDTAKNFDFATGLELIGAALDGQFFSGHLFTTENDFQLDIGRRGKSRLNVAKATFRAKPPIVHDRKKRLEIDPNSFYLKALGITDDNGRIRDRQQDKWRQINKFVEVLSNLVDKSALSDRTELKIVDMGSGKGYLTFAAYDYFRNTRRVGLQLTGVDTNRELVELDNSVAAAAGFDGLEFVIGTIAEYEVGETNILIALHACNTATDDAIYRGIEAGAELIVVAPCCHQQIRPQIRPPEMFRDILKHGVMRERVAETVTDGLRSLLLERSGYSTKLFEFVSTEHTPKNNMLVGTKLANRTSTAGIERQIAAVKTFYGIREHRLEQLLDGRW